MGRRAENALSRFWLAAALAIGAFLRFEGLGRTSYWLDEVLDAQVSAGAPAHPWWHWLTGFGFEHGPLHFAIQLATQLIRGDELAGRFPAALFGVATIALVWFAARLLDERAAGVCALLAAVSPFHVYYSREARPYALLMLLAVALLIAVLRESPVAIALLSFAALYTSAIAAALVAAVAIAFVLERRLPAGRSAAFQAADAGRMPAKRPARMPALLVVVLVLVMFPLLYRSGPAGTGARMPHIDAAEIARAFTVSATGADQRGHTVIAMLIFAAIGAVAVLRRDRRTGAVVLAMTSIPIAVVVAILIATKHFFAFRYIAMALPPFLLLAGIGIATIARPRVLAPLIAVAVMTQTWTAARVEPFRKLDWRGIARAIASHAQPGDMLVVADPTADVMLRYYLGAIPHPLKIANIPYVDVAKVVVARGGPVWIATTYNTSDLSVREWSCRYPLLLANNLEGFRLHYAPSAQHFMRHRAQREELRAIASLNPLELRPGTNDELFLGEGWAAADVIDAATYRWATSTIATIFIPRGERRDRTLVFHALPFLPQRMRVELNGIPLCEQVLVEGWREYSFATPARIWIDGVNTIALRFDRTGRADGDSRPLAMLFDSIAIRDRGTPAGPPSVIPPMRLDALVDRSKDNPRAPADLLARLGLDPTLDVDLRDAALTVAWGPDCIDDATFLQRAFATLLQRGPNPIEERDLLERMRRGASRDHIVERILAAR